MTNSFSRRALLGTIAAGSGLLAAPSILRAQQLFTADPFSLGVAAGDPAADGFVIWTRLCPDPQDSHGGMPMAPVAVTACEADIDASSRASKPELACWQSRRRSSRARSTRVSSPAAARSASRGTSTAPRLTGGSADARLSRSTET